MSTPDTFDTTSFSNAGNSFSNSNRTVLIADPGVEANGTVSMAQLVEGKRSGKFYIEVTVGGTAAPGGHTAGVGIVNSWGCGSGALFFAGYWGGFQGQGGIRYDATGNVWFGSELSPWGTFDPWVIGSTICLQLDFVTPQLSLRVGSGAWNQVTGAMAAMMVNGCLVYPAVGYAAGGLTYTVNTGQTSFLYTVPAGFTAGWPNTTSGTYFGSHATNAQGPLQAPVGVNSIFVSPYVATYTGTITAVVFAPVGGFTVPPGADPAVAVVYDASGGGGAPGALLGSSAAGVGTNPGLYTYTFSPSISITMGHTYYLGILFAGQTGGSTNWVHCPLYTGQVGGYYKSVTYPTPPNPFSTASTADYSLPAIAYAAPAPPAGAFTSFGEII